RVVGREGHSLDADLRHQVLVGGEIVEVGEGVVEVLPQVAADRVPQPGEFGLEGRVEPRQHERRRLTHVTDDDLQRRIAVEHAAEYQPQRVRGGVDVPAPAHRGQGETHLVSKPRVAGLDDRRRRDSGGQVNRNVQCRSAVEDRIEEPVVQVAALAVPVDHRTGKAELADRALELFGRLVGGTDGHSGEAGQPLRKAPDGCGQFVIAGSGQLDGFWTVELLHPGGGQRQHGQVDAGLVHRCDTRLTEVGDRFDQTLPRRQPRARTAEEFLCDVVLFEGDRAHRLLFLQYSGGRCTARYLLAVGGEADGFAVPVFGQRLV